MKYVVLILIAITACMYMDHKFTMNTKDFELEQLGVEKDLKIKLLNHKLAMSQIANKGLVAQVKGVLAKRDTAKVILTWYHPNSGGINTDGDPNNTALMTRPIAGRTIAISKALVRKGWLGKKVYVEGYGIFIAEDRMSSALPGERIDICTSSKRVAMNNGKLRNIFSCIIN